MEDDSYLVENMPDYYGTGSQEPLKDLLRKMVEKKASGLFIMGGDYIWMSESGSKKHITPRKVETAECENLLETAYGSSSGVVQLRSLQPLDFAYQFYERSGGSYRFRVHAISSNGGRSITITFRLIQTTPPEAEELGIPHELIEVCRKNKNGIIYITGATGEGKSTTLASIMRRILEDGGANINMVDIGKPIEFMFNEVKKPTSFVTALNVGIDVASFYEGVVNCMRMEPQIIQISESRDLATIQASMDASKSGHAVFSTVHSPNVPETLRRIVNMFPSGERSSVQLDVVESTSAIVSQKLVKRVGGGRLALREYLVFTPEVREMLWSTSNIGKTAIEVLIKHGRPMTRDIEDVFSQGLISEEDYNSLIFNYERQIRTMRMDGE